MSKKLVNYIAYENFSENRASNFQLVSTLENLTSDQLAVRLLIPQAVVRPSQLKEKNVEVKALIEKSGIRLMSLKLWWDFSAAVLGLLRDEYARQKQAPIIYFRHNILLPTVAAIKYLIPVSDIYYEAHRPSSNLLARLCEKYLFSKGMKLITISGVLKEVYLNKYPVINEMATLVAHDGVDMEKFSAKLSQQQARQHLGIGVHEKIVLYIGSLWLVKGVDIIFKVADKFPDVKFYLVGKQRADFVDHIKRSYKPQNIIIKDQVEQEQVVIYQLAADVLLLPHPKNNLSQSPLKLFEYLASGRPIIYSRLKNLSEIIANTELSFEPEDESSLIEVLNRYWQNKAAYDKQAGSNPDIARQYTWSARGAAIRDFILKHG